MDRLVSATYVQGNHPEDPLLSDEEHQRMLRDWSEARQLAHRAMERNVITEQPHERASATTEFYREIRHRRTRADVDGLP